MTIQRYDPYYKDDFGNKCEAELWPDSFGDVVLNADHEREVAELRKLLVEWRKEHRADHPRRDGCDLCKRTDEVLRG